MHGIITVKDLRDAIQDFSDDTRLQICVDIKDCGHIEFASVDVFKASLSSFRFLCTDETCPGVGTYDEDVSLQIEIVPHDRNLCDGYFDFTDGTEYFPANDIWREIQNPTSDTPSEK